MSFFPPPSDLSDYAKKADMPTPATSAPPSVADSSAKGTDDSVYAPGATSVDLLALEP